MSRGQCYRMILVSSRMSPPVRRYVCLRASRMWPVFLGVLAALCLAGCKRTASQYIKRGNELYDAGRYADATLNYRNAIQKRPNSGEAYYRLGLALFKQSKLVDAYQAFSHAVALDPKDTDAKIQLGGLALGFYRRTPTHPAEFYNLAAKLADQLLAPGGNRAEGLRLKAALALTDKHPDTAIQMLREAERLEPNNADITSELAAALMSGNQADEAEKIARASVQQHPQYNGAYQILLTLYGSQQKWDQAEALLKLWSANNPQEAGPILRLAEFYYGRKRPDDAEKTLAVLLNDRKRFPQADLVAGDFHAMIGDREKALADFRRGESRDKTREQVYQEREASTLMALGRHAEAVKAADVILKKAPKNQFARALKLQALEDIGGAQNLNAAAALARDLAKDAPNNANVQLLAGHALLKAGDLTGAASSLQSAARLNPQSLNAQLDLAHVEVLRRDYTALLAHANAALAIRPRDNQARLLHVMGLAGTHAYDAAKSEAEQLARDTKDAPPVEMQLGVIALGQKDYAKAEELFGKLYKEGSGAQGDLQPLLGLVDTYEAEHMPDKALALMQQETGHAPGSSPKEELLVATAEAAGKQDVALAELQKMAAQNPSSADVQIRIGALEQGRGSFSDALQAYDRARQLAPNAKRVDALVANVEEQMGKTTEAIADYRKALQKSPDDAVLLNNLAFLLADRGVDTDQAFQLINTALRKSPDLPQIRDTLAWVQLKRHNVAEALSILQALTDKYPSNDTFRYHYAAALIASGDRESAKRQAETALANKPSADLAGELRTLLAQAGH